MLALNNGFQRRQACLPETAILIQPHVDRLQWRRVQTVKTVSAPSDLVDEVGMSENSQMF